jgi:anti-sigma factor RsiW
MAECRELESLFASYVDGEAAPRDCAALDAHFRNCPACRDRVAAERVVREAVAARRGTLRECASAELRRRCEAHCQRSVDREGARVRSGGFSGFSGGFSKKTWVPLSMVATLVLAIAGVFLYGLSGSVEALGTQLAADHVKCFEFASLPTILPDAKVLGREWAQSRGWAVTVPESASVEQLELMGIRRCISSEGQTAHVMYKWRGQPFSVYVLNSEHPRVGSVPRLVERLGQEAMIWSKGGRTYAVVTRGSPSEIERIAQYVQRSAQ